MIDERMRTMTPVQRIDIELELRKRNRHTVDYDPLPYNYNGYDPLPVDVGPMGQDNWGAGLRRPPGPASRKGGRGW